MYDIDVHIYIYINILTHTHTYTLSIILSFHKNIFCKISFFFVFFFFLYLLARKRNVRKCEFFFFNKINNKKNEPTFVKLKFLEYVHVFYYRPPRR